MENNLNIFEKALMDIGRKQKAPDIIQRLFNTPFQEIVIDSIYTINGVNSSADNGAIHHLTFHENKPETFPGVRLYSDELFIVKDKNGESENLLGRVAITFHEDTLKWTCFLHLYDENKEHENRLVQINGSNFLIKQ